MMSLSSCCRQREGQSRISDHCASLIFRLLGIGILVPWNAFISAVPYFQSRICSIPGASEEFEAWVGLIFNLSSVGALFLLLAWPLLSQEGRCRRLLVGWWRHRQRNSSISRRGIPHRDSDDDDIIPQDSNDTNNIHPPSLSTTSQPCNNNHSYWQVTLPLAICMAVFVATDILVTVKSIRPLTFLAITLWGIALCGACQAFAQSGILATSGSYPSAVGITPFISGQAVGGVIVSAANFLSAVAEGSQSYWEQHCNNIGGGNYNSTAFVWQQRTTTTQHSTDTAQHQQNLHDDAEDSTTACPTYDKFDTAVFLYFLIGAIVLFACLVCYMILLVDQRTQQQQQLQQEQYQTVPIESATASATTTTLEQFQDEPSPQLEHRRHPHPFDITQLSCDSISVHDVSYETSSDEHDGIIRVPDTVSVEEAVLTNRQPTGKSVLQCIKGPAFCIFFTFFVTLALFPSWTSRLRSIHQCQPSSGRLSNDLYVPFTFLLFNIGDLSGREIAGRLPVNRISNLSYKLVFAACGRCLFFPLLLICASGSQANKDSLDIPSDFYSFAVQAMFSLTNGGLISLAFMHAPTLLPNAPGAMEKSSEILTLCCSLGLLCGSLFAFPVSHLAA
jgi:Nucleoside transporter